MDQDNRPSSEIASALIYRLVRAIRASQTADDLFDELAVDFLGIGRSDGRCLDIIDRLGRVTAGRLAAESGLTTGAVTALVDRMERAGYLRRTRDPADRRKVWIEVTDLTRRFNRHLWGHLATVMPPLFARFTPEQLAAIAEFLEIGAYINRQRAALLQEHLPPGGAGPDNRLAEAEAFEADALRLADDLGERLRDDRAPHDFADPGVTEE